MSLKTRLTPRQWLPAVVIVAGVVVLFHLIDESGFPGPKGKLILTALLFAAASCAASLHALTTRRRGEPGKLPARTPGRGASLVQWQLGMAVLIWLLTRDGQWSAAELGVRGDWPWAAAFLAGAAIYFALISVVTVVARALGRLDRLLDLSFEALRVVWPREVKGKRLAVFAVCVLNPFTEEILYRGALIYGVGSLTGDFATAVVLGLSLSLVAHLYQGPAALPGQALFHGTAVAILFSPLGLVGCFGLHFAGDLVPVAWMRRSMRLWVRRRRAAPRAV